MEVDQAIKHAERALRNTLRSTQNARRMMASVMKHRHDLGDDTRVNVVTEDQALSRIETYVAHALSSLPDDADHRAQSLMHHLKSVELLSMD